jgi:hypothetical protein
MRLNAVLTRTCGLPRLGRLSQSPSKLEREVEALGRLDHVVPSAQTTERVVAS